MVHVHVHVNANRNRIVHVHLVEVLASIKQLSRHEYDEQKAFYEDTQNMQQEQLVDNYVTIDKPAHKQNASESERREELACLPLEGTSVLDSCNIDSELK